MNCEKCKTPIIVYKSHAELEQWHYRAVRDSPEYRQEGMLDVLREEMSGYIPYRHYELVVSPATPQKVDLTPLKIDLAKMNNRINNVGDALKKHLEAQAGQPQHEYRGLVKRE